VGQWHPGQPNPVAERNLPTLGVGSLPIVLAKKNRNTDIRTRKTLSDSTEE